MEGSVEVAWEIFDVAQPEEAIGKVVTAGPANTTLEALKAWAKETSFPGDPPVWENGVWVLHESGGREMGGASMSARVAAPVEPVAEEPQSHGWDIVEVGGEIEPVGKSYGATVQEALLRFALDVGMEGPVAVDYEVLPTRSGGHLEPVEQWRLTNGPFVVTARPEIRPDEPEVIVWYTVPVAVQVNLATREVTRVVVVDEEVGLVTDAELGLRPSLVARTTHDDGTAVSPLHAEAAIDIAHSGEVAWPAWEVGA